MWRLWVNFSTLLGRELISWSWHAGLPLASVWLVASLLPRGRPSVRNTLWLAALLMLPLIPVATRVTPLPLTSVQGIRDRLHTVAPGAPVRPETPAAASPAGASVLEQVPPSIVSGSPAREARGVQGQAWRRDLAAVLVLAWLVGVGAMLVRLCLAARWVRDLCRQAPEVGDHWHLDVLRKVRQLLDLPRPVDLRESEAVPTPVTVGLVWPVVVLPVGLLHSGRQDLIESALCHEMAHVKRWDTVATLYRRLLEALFFFHPLVWVATRRCELEQEHLCDDWAVGVVRDRRGYARSLTELADMAMNGPRVPALSFAHRPSVMRRRVTRLVEGKEMGSPRIELSGKVLVIVVSVALLAAVSSLPLSRVRVEAAGAKRLPLRPVR
jgi:D-alanyl-D-alanine endopeptidase (penicillin-binding protein 7)